ncbi:peptidase, partial [Streptomyces sp. NPDC006510]
MNARTSRTVVAAALVLGIAAGPAAPALAAAGTPAATATRQEPAREAPDAGALRAAIRGLPKDDATA